MTRVYNPANTAQPGEGIGIAERSQGLVHGFREMRRLGYQLEEASLAYRGRQGVDAVFSEGNDYAILETKAGESLSLLKTYAGNLRQRSGAYNISRLQRYLQYGSGENDALANKLLWRSSERPLEGLCRLLPIWQNLRAATFLASNGGHSAIAQMAMSPTEMEQFFTRQAEMFEAGAEKARSAGNVHSASVSLETAFQSRLMLALLTWRYGKNAPMNELRGAVDSARHAVGMLGERSDGIPVWRSFDVGPALFLEGLVGETPALRGASCPRSAWLSVELERAQHVLDVATVEYRNTNAIELGQLLERLGAQKRLGLLAATYDNYRAAVDAVKKSDLVAALETARKGDQLFARRARDSFYSGGRQTEGGGPDNPHVVDYRLAILLNHGPWVAVLRRKAFLTSCEGQDNGHRMWIWTSLQRRGERLKAPNTRGRRPRTVSSGGALRPALAATLRFLGGGGRCCPRPFPHRRNRGWRRLRTGS